jgi:hypothetical protein
MQQLCALLLLVLLRLALLRLLLFGMDAVCAIPLLQRRRYCFCHVGCVEGCSCCFFLLLLLLLLRLKAVAAC